MQTVQDLMIKDLLEVHEDEKQNETVEILEFFRQNGTPLTSDQVSAFLLLNEFGLGDIANYANNIRPMMTTERHYFRAIDKLTLADRIKGNAKLSSILKANANPANALTASDVQAKAMKRSEIDKY
jgi:hypothetical protein